MEKINRLKTGNRRINGSLTKRVIELHHYGYISDFQILDDHRLFCMQDNRFIPVEDVTVKVIDQCYDKLSHTFKYIHTIETCCGEKGLLLAEAILSRGHSFS